MLNGDDGSYDYLTAAVMRKRRLGLRPRGPPRHGGAPDVWAEGVNIFAGRIGIHRGGARFQLCPSRLPWSETSTSPTAWPPSRPPVGALGVAAGGRSGRVGQLLAGVPGRMERIDLGQPFTALVDFAHTPNALRRALETARQMTPTAAGRLIVVFGGAGLRDVEKRGLMAEVAAELADITILTAEDPRTELPDAILDIWPQGRGPGGRWSNPRPPWRRRRAQRLLPCARPGRALRLAVKLARPGDLVMACGKGHEQSMCFGKVEYPWDDRTALRAALAEP